MTDGLGGRADLAKPGRSRHHPPMLHLFGPGCSTDPVDPSKIRSVPDGAVWLDLFEPTRQEEALAEKVLGGNIPTRDEMVEIEPSSRLYERGGAVFMTMSVLHGIDENDPASDPVSFILTDKHLVTIRYVDPKPFKLFGDHCRAEPELVSSSTGAFIRLVDAIVSRQADVIESVGRTIENVSTHVFRRRQPGTDRRSTDRLEALILKIGRIQTLLARIRETSVSTTRLLSFLDSTDLADHDRSKAHVHLHSLIADSAALSDQANFLSDNLTFLLDAALGLIGVEQNMVMKIWSVVAVVLMPPTLVAGIYGMNFEHIPELKWLYGYPYALVVMLVSAVLPYWIARKKGWL
ncbi:magnesium transporter CorA family protein [Sphingomonas sp. ASV193]|uniref:magnesium transporter CorA family protein n=1 Tax=Sphingomonas sp. ASV193 TaxID=3144405 RepID=UPI0032E8E06D